MTNIGYLHESAMAASLRCSLATVAQDRVASLVTSTSQSVAVAESRLIGLETRTEALEHAQLAPRLEQLELACRSAQQQLNRFRDERAAAETALAKELESTRAELTGTCKDTANKVRDQGQQLGDAHRDFAAAQRRQSEELSKLPRLDGRLDAVNTRHAALDELVLGYHDDAEKRARVVSELVDKVQKSLAQEITQGSTDTHRFADKFDGQIESHGRHLAQIDVRIDQLEAALKSVIDQVSQHREKSIFAEDALQKAVEATRETFFRKIQDHVQASGAVQAELSKGLWDQAHACDVALAQLSSKFREQGQELAAARKEFMVNHGKHSEELGRLRGLQGGLETTNRHHAALDQVVVSLRRETTELRGTINEVQRESGLQLSQYVSENNRHFGMLDGQLEMQDRRMESVQILAEKLPDIVSKQQQIHNQMDEIITSAQSQLEMELSIARSQLDRHLTDLSTGIQHEMETEVRESRQFLSEFLFEARESLARMPQVWAEHSEALRSGCGVGDRTETSWNAGRLANASPASLRQRASSAARRQQSPRSTSTSKRAHARAHSQAHDRSQPGMHIISATGWS